MRAADESIDGVACDLHADYRRLFEGNPLPMWIFDLDTHAILEVNEAAVRHYGYSRQEFLRLTLTDLRPAEDLPRLAEHLPRTRDNPSPGTTQWRHRTKDGRLIDVEVTSFRVTFVGRAAKVVLANDVTARKRAEHTIRALLRAVVAAQEEERRRIALELHDDTAQSLATLLLELHKLEEARSLDVAQAVASELRLRVALALDEVRRIARGLRPAALDALGLGEALKRLGAEFAERHAVAVDVHVGDLEERLPPPIETALYRIAQETLANVGRHAGARNVGIVAQLSGREVRLIVEDDGAGFDVSASPSKAHLGLDGIRERAASLGGELSVESTLDEGTTLYVTVPLGERER